MLSCREAPKTASAVPPVPHTQQFSTARSATRSTMPGRKLSVYGPRRHGASGTVATSQIALVCITEQAAHTLRAKQPLFRDTHSSCSVGPLPEPARKSGFMKRGRTTEPLGPFLGSPGPRNTDASLSPLETVRIFMDANFVAHVLRTGRSKACRSKPQIKFTPRTFWVWTFYLIASGIAPRGQERDYWSNNPFLRHSDIPNILPYPQLTELKKYLTGTVSFMTDHFNTKGSQVWFPFQYVVTSAVAATTP